MIAVEPGAVKTVCEEIKDIVAEKSPLIISVASDVNDSHMREWLGNDAAIVRVMPNTPSSVGAGASGLYANVNVTPEQKSLSEHIMRAVGIVIWVDNESLINAVAALSGSGPAYVFLVMEALQAAGEALGLSEENARLLTLQTVQGAARMALESEHDVTELRRFITVPGGSTEQGIKVFEERGIRNIFEAALKAAHNHTVKVAESL
ncbi:pyrroline-5-carboxylate reductase family protein [Candidiatus Paracoxiella cheracis]|uniref:pyrroline-5-carboxylate reductase family protein n=1 Tax=Candidiatus Paracoxiella cheracis TaxID=3405120 RepID=UPI003BF5A726